MNIAIFIDKHGSAIDRLAQSVVKHNPHFNIRVIPVHPKRNSPEEMGQAQLAMQWADLIDVHYWKSGEVIRQAFPSDFEAKKRIVCHFNPYDLDKLEWLKYYDLVVTGNEDMRNKIPYSYLIPYMIDLDFFKFNDNYTEEKTVMMSVARIESKKGVLEVAQACAELGYKFYLVGRISDRQYMDSVMKAGGELVEFFEDVEEEELRDLYYKSAIHVCNSTDDFESGTLPILEAMACGVPVLTRKVGHVPELFNKGNLLIRHGAKEDIEDLKTQLKSLMENRDQRIKMRETAWYTVKNRTDKKMARMFSKVYYQALGEGKPLVSIIIPTYNRGEALVDVLVGACQQAWKHTEIVISDSGDYPVDNLVRRLLREQKFPVKYIHFEHKDEYTLAEARNRAVIEAQGDVLVFCDDRLKMDKTAVSKFVEFSRFQTWNWGIKDSSPKEFVENFSSIQRTDLIKAGMFCERINKYGGMSEEIRSRFTKLGYEFELVPEAKAESVTRTKSRSRRREDIIESKLTLFKMYA